MIISFKHKFIFVKTRKTGGTSIQVELSKICGPNDIITGELVDSNGKVWESYGPGQNADRFITDNPHPDLLTIKTWMDNNGYDWYSFKKFAIVRHPFDLIVSRYHWDIGGKAKQATSIQGFKTWLNTYFSSGHYEKDIQYKYTHLGGLLHVDYIGYYEDLKNSYKDICELINIDYTSLLKLKSGHRLSGISFWDYYDSNDKLKVLKYFEDDINTYPYNVEIKQFDEVGDRHECIWNDGHLGLDNINGPSVIKIPKFVKDDLGIDYTYQMYFAHHQGKSIRYAYSNNLVDWDWRFENVILNECLKLENTYCDNHIASPDAHVDASVIRMYYHGDMNNKQYSFFAVSVDGVNFHKREIMKKPLGHFYFRVFDYKGERYALAKEDNIGGILYQYDPDTEHTYVPICRLLPNMRHAAVHIEGDILFIFYSIIGDAPEHIRVSKWILSENVFDWQCVLDQAVIYPKEEFEGIKCKVEPSTPGAVYGLHSQLRDPYLFKDDDGKLYLYYAAGGENSIGCVELKRNY